MKLLFFILLILILPVQVNAVDFNAVITQYNAATGGGEPTTISEDFSGADLSAWTQESGTWVLDTVNDELDSPTSTAGVISHNTQLDTVNQYVVVKFVDKANDFLGVYFRFDGNIANRAYTVRVNDVANTVVWRTCIDTSCSDIGSPWANDVDNGDYVGIEVEGIGDATIVRAWDFGTSVPDRGSWGAPGNTWTDNPGASNEANTGRYVGLYDGDGTAAGTFDDFSAGTYTP